MLAMLRIIVKFRSCPSVLRKDQRVKLNNILVELTGYCRDRVSSCNIYTVQQDTQSFLMIEFYSSHMLARYVSDLTGPS